MYTKVTPKAGQNGPMWLYAGSEATFLPVWLGISYNYFSMMVVGYMGSYKHDLCSKGHHSGSSRDHAVEPRM